ncbi:MAG: hypothetical protein IT308_06555 [Anaerolineaceae bacterium]|nr:hypothetical protein [Anaerolineaceae bacterium]
MGWERYALQTPIQPVTVVIDRARCLATVKTQDREIVLRDVPVGESPYSLLQQVNAVLAQSCQPFVAWRLEWVSGAIVPAEEGDFITELAREMLRGAELDDLQSLFADKMRVSSPPMGSLTEISPALVPVSPKTWLEWALKHQAAKIAAGRRSSGKRSNTVQPGQLSTWSNLKEE